MRTTLTGADALAQGAIEAGVLLVTGYAGAPATSVVNSLLKLSKEETIRVEWTSNEKVAIEMAFGASVAGARSLLCVKSVGLNIALDPLMDAVRAGVSMLVLILDNGLTALSGGQPHPASPRDARGNPRSAVDMAALARSSGVRTVETIAVHSKDRLKVAIETGLKAEGISVIIASGPCPRYQE